MLFIKKNENDRMIPFRGCIRDFVPELSLKFPIPVGGIDNACTLSDEERKIIKKGTGERKRNFNRLIMKK